MDEPKDQGEHHEHHAHESAHIVKPHVEGFVDKVRSNPWMVTSMVLAVILIILVIFGSSIFSGKKISPNGSAVNGVAVTPEVAGQKLITFINSQGKGNATLVSTAQENGLYKITVKYQNQDIPVLVTPDGNFLVGNTVPLTTEANAAAANTQQANTQQQQAAPQVQKSDKPTVDLFVMSYCPYGTQIEKGIIPVATLLKDKINFNIRWVSYSMHGKNEVDENTRQYCIEKEQNAKYLPYLQCFLGAGESASCLTSTGIDTAKLNACVASADTQYNITANFNNQASWLNGRYPIFAIDQSDNNKYGVQGSPTLVINGGQVSSARDPESLLKTVCAAFNTAPSECSQTLSTASPQPGFGTATTAASTTTGTGAGAQCG